MAKNTFSGSFDLRSSRLRRARAALRRTREEDISIKLRHYPIRYRGAQAWAPIKPGVPNTRAPGLRRFCAIWDGSARGFRVLGWKPGSGLIG
jgi:hypothetical protein